MHRSASPARTPTTARSSRAPIRWAAVDVALILVFAISGRSTHERGISVVGVLDTAWPFLLAYAAGTLALRAWRSPASPTPTGVALWAITAAGGLVLRALSGGGMAVSFQVVTFVVLGVLLLLPRLLVAVVSRRRSRRVP